MKIKFQKNYRSTIVVLNSFRRTVVFPKTITKQSKRLKSIINENVVKVR